MPLEPTEPPPLEYRTPGSDGADTAWLTLAFVGGLVAAVITAVLVSWVGVLALPAWGDRGFMIGISIAFFAGAVTVTVSFVRRLRAGRGMTTEARRRRGRFLLLGFLLGLGVIWLLQGLCFATFSRLNLD